MKDGDVRIVELPPMRVALVHAFGRHPEIMALEALRSWSAWTELLPRGSRVFGFNNPSPTERDQEYGYDLWITLDGAEVEPVDGVTITDVEGGLYAVARCNSTGDPEVTIPAAWQDLVIWQQRSGYAFAGHQWLEEHLEPEKVLAGDFALDLFLPIASKQHRDLTVG